MGKWRLFQLLRNEPSLARIMVFQQMNQRVYPITDLGLKLNHQFQLANHLMTLLNCQVKLWH